MKYLVLLFALGWYGRKFLEELVNAIEYNII